MQEEALAVARSVQSAAQIWLVPLNEGDGAQHGAPEREVDEDREQVRDVEHEVPRLVVGRRLGPVLVDDRPDHHHARHTTQ